MIKLTKIKENCVIIYQKLHAYFFLVIAMAFWGLSWPVSKSLVTGVSPFLVGFFRFLFASIVYVPILLVKHWQSIKSYTLETYRDFTILGILGIFGYGIIFLFGMQLTTASQGSVLAGIQPVLISTLAFFFFKEKLSPLWRYIGFFFSLSGVIAIIGIQALLFFNLQILIGNILVVSALLLFACYSIYGKRVMQKISSFESTVGATVIGMIFFGLGALIDNQWESVANLGMEFWGGIIVLAIGTTVVGFFCYFYAIQKIGATKTGIFINLVPVFGTAFSVILLDEELSWTLWLGLILVSTGIIIINFPKKNNPMN